MRPSQALLLDALTGSPPPRRTLRNQLLEGILLASPGREAAENLVEVEQRQQPTGGGGRGDSRSAAPARLAGHAAGRPQSAAGGRADGMAGLWCPGEARAGMEGPGGHEGTRRRVGAGSSSPAECLIDLTQQQPVVCVRSFARGSRAAGVACPGGHAGVHSGAKRAPAYADLHHQGIGDQAAGGGPRSAARGSRAAGMMAGLAGHEGTCAGAGAPAHADDVHQQLRGRHHAAAAIGHREQATGGRSDLFGDHHAAEAHVLAFPEPAAMSSSALDNLRQAREDCDPIAAAHAKRRRNNIAEETPPPCPLEAEWRRFGQPQNRVNKEAVKWSHAKDDALEVMAKAVVKWPQISVWPDGVAVDISKEMMLQRCRQAVRTALKGGGKCYVGSTSCPIWRWEGGYFYRSEARALKRALQPDFMLGHRAAGWSRMLLLGSWSDEQTKSFEEAAIAAARAVAADLNKSSQLVNIADDSRGFTVQSHHYGFIYVCS
eukprot:9487623-Pyramimonas_sp.AAC.1